MGAWNWLDWTLAALVCFSVITALQKGFVRELISLASLVVGLVVAALNYQRAASWFDSWLKSHELAQAAGFLTLFLGTLIVGGVVSGLANKLVRSAGLEWFDRFLGGLFGLLRGVILGSVLLMAMVAFAIRPETVQRSSLAPYMTLGARTLAVVMPAELKRQFHQGFDKLREALDQEEKKITKN